MKFLKIIGTQNQLPTVFGTDIKGYKLTPHTHQIVTFHIVLYGKTEPKVKNLFFEFLAW